MVRSRKRKNAGNESKDKEPNPGKEQNDEESSRETPRNIIADAPIEEKQTFDRIFGEVEDYTIVLLDPSGKILSWNRGAEKINGYAAKDIIDKKLPYPLYRRGQTDQLFGETVGGSENQRQNGLRRLAGQT